MVPRRTGREAAVDLPQRPTLARRAYPAARGRDRRRGVNDLGEFRRSVAGVASVVPRTLRPAPRPRLGCPQASGSRPLLALGNPAEAEHSRWWRMSTNSTQADSQETIQVG